MNLILGWPKLKKYICPWLYVLIITIGPLLSFNSLAFDVTAGQDLGAIPGSCNQPLTGSTTVCVFNQCEEVEISNTFYCVAGENGVTSGITPGPLIEPGDGGYRTPGPSSYNNSPIQQQTGLNSTTAPAGGATGGGGTGLPAYLQDDSCIDQQTLLGIFIDILETLGANLTVSQNFAMTAYQAEGLESCQLNQFPDQTGSKCGGINNTTCNGSTCAGRCLTRCDSPSDYACFVYNVSGTNVLVCLADGQTAVVTPGANDLSGGLDNIWFQAVTQNDMLCVQYMNYESWLGLWVTLGCRFTRDHSDRATLTTPCYISTSCFDRAAANSQVFLAVSSLFVQCFKDTIGTIFYPDSAETCPGSIASVTQVQQSLKSAIFAALTLYVILFAINTILSGHVPSASELIIFLIKMILVINFSVGLAGPNCTGISPYCNSIQWIYEALTGAMNSFSSMLINAPGAGNLCNPDQPSALCVYDSSSYPDGYGYLSLWDALDCRVGFYFGLYDPNLMILVALILLLLILGCWLLLALAAGGLLFAIFTIGFGILVFDLVIVMVEVTVMSIFAVAILVYLAPLMVPLALFEATKEHFQNWLDLLIGFTLQPMVLALFIALLFSIFDNLMFSTCCFKQQVVSMPVAGFPGNVNNTQTASNATAVQYKCFPFFIIQLPSDQNAQKQCQSSFGWAMSAFTDGDVSSFFMVLFPISMLGDPSQFINLLLTMVMLLVFAYVAWEFIDLLAAFSQDLVGGQMQLDTKKIKNRAKNMLQGAAQGTAGLYKAAHRIGQKKNKDKDQKSEGAEPTVTQGNKDNNKPSVSISGNTKGSSDA